MKKYGRKVLTWPVDCSNLAFPTVKNKMECSRLCDHFSCWVKDCSATNHYRLPPATNSWPRLWGGGLTLCPGTIGIFCSLSWQDEYAYVFGRMYTCLVSFRCVSAFIDDCIRSFIHVCICVYLWISFYDCICVYAGIHSIHLSSKLHEHSCVPLCICINVYVYLFLCIYMCV